MSDPLDTMQEAAKEVLDCLKALFPHGIDSSSAAAYAIARDAEQALHRALAAIPELREQQEANRYADAVARVWVVGLIDHDNLRVCCHPLAMVRTALAGETDPVKLGCKADELELALAMEDMDDFRAALAARPAATRQPGQDDEGDSPDAKALKEQLAKPVERRRRLWQKRNPHGKPTGMSVENPRDVPRAQEMIRQLCALQAHVVSEVFGYEEPADCFCGDEGFWPYKRVEDYRNAGHAVEFIREATLEAIRRRPAATEDEKEPDA